MYKTYQAHYKKGKIELDEIPEDIIEADVLVTFIDKIKLQNNDPYKRILGKDKGKVLISKEFFDPLPDDIISEFNS